MFARSLFRNKDIKGQCRPRKVVEFVSKSTFEPLVGLFRKWFVQLVGLFRKWYEEILVFFRALALSLDPLFFYVPVIREDKKCIELNKVVWTIAIVSRSVSDVVYLVHFVVKSYRQQKSKANTTCPEKGLNIKSNTTRWATVRRHLWSIMFNVLVILPIPQVRETLATL